MGPEKSQEAREQNAVVRTVGLLTLEVALSPCRSSMTLMRAILEVVETEAGVP